jgi:hypothetical protein
MYIHVITAQRPRHHPTAGAKSDVIKTPSIRSWCLEAYRGPKLGSCVFGPRNTSIVDLWALNIIVKSTKTAQEPPHSGPRNAGTKAPPSVTPL